MPVSLSGFSRCRKRTRERQHVTASLFNRHLSLSTNNIERIAGLNGMTSLEILSLGRNLIKKLEGFDGISESLQALWISYNLLEKLVRSQYHCVAWPVE